LEDRLLSIKDILEQPALVADKIHFNGKASRIDHREYETGAVDGICFYKEPGCTPAIDAEDYPATNLPAVSIFGNEMDLRKTFSDFDPDEKEMNLACMSGQFDNILYPNEKQLFFGIGFNETCGTFFEDLTIPEGIDIPVNSVLNFKVHMKFDEQADSEVYRLLPGNSGIRLHDLVGVMGTVAIKISYFNAETGQEEVAEATYTFLDKFKSSDVPEMGYYEDTVSIPLSLPLVKNRYGEFPRLTVLTVINISTYTGKNFLPGEILQTARQYALVDFRKLQSSIPSVTPERSKKGPGGVRLQWYKLCFPTATEPA
jgi:hypothetical protein